MSSFAAIIKSRAELRDSRDRLIALRTIIADVEGRIVATTSHRDFVASVGNAGEQALLDAKIAFLQSQKTMLEAEAAAVDEQIAALATADDALRDTEPALWESVPPFPVALFPVRIETRFAEPETPGGVDLLIRIYPDDVHIVAAREDAGRDSNGNRSARPPTQARLLPTNWNAFALRSGELLFHMSGKAIPRDLPVSLSPVNAAGGRQANDALLGRWLVDFKAAVDVGMAMRVHLDDPNPTIDQLFVMGVDQDATARQTSAAIAAALDGHVSRAGLGFLPVGARTNNTSDAPAAWSASPAIDVNDETPARRRRPRPKDSQNAALLARAFGLTLPRSLAAVPGALDDGQTSVATITAAIWQALATTWLGELVSVRVFETGSSNTTLVTPPADVTEALRQHTVRHVRSRGPLPTIRVGRQPYGLLPTSSLDLWSGDDELDRHLIQPLKDLRVFWEAGLANVPRKTGATDQDQAILDILARRARSSGVVTRSMSGVKDPSDSLEPLVASPSVPWNASLNMTELSDDTETLPDELPLIGDAEAFARRLADKAALIRERLTPEKVSSIQSAIWSTHVGGGPAPESERDLSADAKASLGRVNNLLNVLLQKTLSIAFMAAFENLAEVPFEEVEARLAAVSIDIQTQQADILESLAAIPPDDFEPALLEILDVFSYRLDAWITSLATRRLDAMRSERAAGCHVGGYGWVENLTRDPQPENPPARVGEFARVLADPTHTYILAPSLHHATTAAVLRAGFESHASPDAFAVRLTSRRARTARWILDGVRTGQPLGALLGYRFERGLHDRELDARIDDFRRLFPMPVVPEHDREDDAGDAREAIAAQNVVDGLALHRGAETVPTALKDGIDDLFTELGDAIDSVGDLLLAESVHQLVSGHPIRAGLAADTLGRGESIPDRFDVLRTPQSARAVGYRVAIVIPVNNQLAAHGWNRERPRAQLSPELEAWASHVLGDAKDWRIACEVTRDGTTRQAGCRLDELGISALDVVFESAPAERHTGSILERRIADHVASGAPHAQVRFTPGEPGREDWTTLAALAARMRQTLANAAPLLPRDVDPLDVDSHKRVIPRTLVDRGTQFLKGLAAAIKAVDTALKAAARSRGEAPQNTSAEAVASALLDLTAFGVTGAYPIVAVPPSSDADRSALLQQGRVVLAALEARDLKAQLPRPPAMDDDVTLRGWLEQTGRTLRAAVGDAFLILPVFRPAADGEFAHSLEGDPPQGGDATNAAAWVGRISALRPRVRNLHDTLAAAEALGTIGVPAFVVTQAPRSTGGGLGQRTTTEPWIALPFTTQRAPVAQRTMVIHAPAPLPAIADDVQLCGLIVDEWTEHLPGLDALGGVDRTAINALVQQALRSGAELSRSIEPTVRALIAAGGVTDENGAPLADASRLHFSDEPAIDFAALTHAQSEIAGLSFRYDQPDARAPQAILVAVPPDPQRPWTLDTLLQIARETLDLARLRGVELRDLPRMTPLVPVTYVRLEQRALEPVTVTFEQENADGTITSGSFLSTPQRVDEWRSDLPL